MPYRWPRAPVCCWICRGIHSYRRIMGSMVLATTSYRQGIGSMVPATMSYHRGMGSMMPATTSYRRGMFCFPITQGWAAVRTLVLEGRNTQVRGLAFVIPLSQGSAEALVKGCQKVREESW